MLLATLKKKGWKQIQNSFHSQHKQIREGRGGRSEFLPAATGLYWWSRFSMLVTRTETAFAGADNANWTVHMFCENSVSPKALMAMLRHVLSLRLAPGLSSYEVDLWQRTSGMFSTGHNITFVNVVLGPTDGNKIFKLVVRKDVGLIHSVSLAKNSKSGLSLVFDPDPLQWQYFNRTLLLKYCPKLQRVFSELHITDGLKVVVVRSILHYGILRPWVVISLGFWF